MLLPTKKPFYVCAPLTIALLLITSPAHPQRVTNSSQRAEPQRHTELGPENKFDPDLRQAYLLILAGNYQTAKSFLKHHAFTLYDDSSEKDFSFDVEIEVLLGTEEESQRLIEQHGGKVLSRYHHLMSTRITPALLVELAKSNDILVIKRLSPVITTEYPSKKIVSEGVGITLADLWHEKGYKGKGIKIAVIDLGFQGYQEAQANGELPANMITKAFGWSSFEDLVFPNGDHGERCAEIIHDMAPDAQLYLIRVSDKISLLESIDYLIGEKVNIVSASIAMLDGGPFDGTSRLSKKIDGARSKGILWINAAGNEAPWHWEGEFNDNGNGFHVWKDKDTKLEFSPSPQGPITIYFSWNDWGVGQDQYPDGNTAGQDYKLRLLQDGNLIEEISSNNKNNKYADPELQFFIDQSNPESTYEVEVERLGNTAQGKHLEMYCRLSKTFEYPEETGSIPLLSDAKGAMSIGAVNSLNELKTYSSRGPTNGKGGGQEDETSRIKPDLATVTDVSVTKGWLFSGTSAATPHVAGAAALVKEAHPSFKPADIQQYLEEYATKISSYPDKKNNEIGSGALALNDPKMVGSAPIVLKANPAELDVSLNQPLDSNGNVIGSINVHGYHFLNNAKAKFDPPSLKVNSVKVVNDSEMVINIAGFESGTKPGHLNLIVTNNSGAPDESQGSGKGLILLDIPSITSMAPPWPANKFELGWSGEVVIAGKFFKKDAAVDLGQGVSVKDVQFVSDHKLKILMEIDPKTNPGIRTLVVTSPMLNQVQATKIYQIFSKPIIAAITPPSIKKGGNGVIEIYGNGIATGATVVDSEGKIIGNSYDYSGVPEYLKFHIDVANNASPGNHEMSLINPDGGETSFTFGVVDVPMFIDFSFFKFW